ncbi:unnamed protein product [Victoria cruziana]
MCSLDPRPPNLSLSLSLSLLLRVSAVPSVRPSGCFYDRGSCSLREMGKARDRGSCLRREPHFFKVILEGSREKLIIPPAFARRIKNESKHAILDSRAVKNWPVELLHDGDSLVIHNGWKEFFKLQGLEVGDFLVFRYDGNMHFTVRAFGKSCCEYSYVRSEEHTDAIGRIRQPVRMSSRHPARDYSEACENTHRVENSNLFCGKDISHTHRKIVRKCDIEAPPTSRQLLSENHSFEVVMRRWGGRIQTHVRVPAEFTKELEELSRSFKTAPGKAMEFDLYNLSDPVLKHAWFTLFL